LAKKYSTIFCSRGENEHVMRNCCYGIDYTVLVYDAL